jgi:hypothetical protein
MMGSSESSGFLSPIVATLRADVQGGVRHTSMWTKPRKSFHREERIVESQTGSPQRPWRLRTRVAASILHELSPKGRRIEVIGPPSGGNFRATLDPDRRLAPGWTASCHTRRGRHRPLRRGVGRTALTDVTTTLRHVPAYWHGSGGSRWGGESTGPARARSPGAQGGTGWADAGGGKGRIIHHALLEIIRGLVPSARRARGGAVAKAAQ